MTKYDDESPSDLKGVLPLLDHDHDAGQIQQNKLISLAYVVAASIVSYLLVVTFVLLQG